MKIIPAAAPVLALALAAAPAAAGVYNFSYDYGSGTIAGQIEGILQPDGNTIYVDSVLDYVTDNGVPGPALTFVDSADLYFLGAAGVGVATLDGSYLDLLACNDAVCIDGFIFAVGNLISALAGGDIFESGVAFGDVSPAQPFNAAGWSMSVPGPATLPLLLIGAAGLGTLRRRA